MKKNMVMIVAVVIGLTVAGCKNKNDDAKGAVKATEGSAAVGPANGSPATSGSDTAKPTEPATKSLLETAKQAGSFTTFLKAVDAAGITEQLNGPGPFTVFAPTDDAFAKLASKDLDALLADKAKLDALLQYHVVSGNRSTKDLAAAKTEKSITGSDLAIDAASGLKIAGANVVKPDLVASNGVIHGIDNVLTPPVK